MDHGDITVLGDLITKKTPMVDVRAYGATGDGITDDTAAVESALTALGASGGGTLFFPAGTYLMNVVNTYYVIIQGSGENSTFLKSYSSSGYAWYEKNTTGDWKHHAVFNDLTFLGDSANRNGFCFGDPSTYEANMEYAGRCIFNRVYFQALKIAVFKPYGNLGNVFNECNFTGAGDYHFYAQAYGAMYPGVDEFNNCEFESAQIASIYINDLTIGGGMVNFNRCIFESNAGFAVFVYSSVTSNTPIRFKDCYFEANATAGSVIINGTTYATLKDVYLRNTRGIIFDGSNSCTYYLVDSQATEYNARVSAYSDVTADSTSIIYSYNIRSNAAGTLGIITGRKVYSYSECDGRVGGTSDLLLILPRDNVQNSYTLTQGDSFSGPGPWAFGGGTNATSVVDGVLYPNCAELTVPATTDKIWGNFSHSTTKWYVWSIDIKLTTTAKPNSVSMVGTGDFVGDFSLALEKDKWVSVGGINLGNDTTSNALWITGHATDDVTLRLSALQIVEFNTEQEAVNYFNSRTYNASPTTAKYFLAAPNAADGTPSFRAIVASDVPTLNQNTSGTASNLSGTPALTNGTTAITQAAGDNSTKLATTAYADAKVADAINDGTTTIAPSQNAVFDALAGKTTEGVWEDYFATSTKVGWTTPTGNIYIKKIGKTVFVNYAITGTSDATSASFTVPYTSGATVHYEVKCGRAIDNTSTEKGLAYSSLVDGVTVVNLYSDYTTSTWTASGTKTIIGQFWYVID